MLPGSWSQKFDPVPGLMDFKMRGGTKVQRSFMERTSGAIEFGWTETLCLVRIPYKEAGFSMLVAIPRNEHEDIREYSSSLPIKQSLIGAICAACAMVQFLVKIAGR